MTSKFASLYAGLLARKGEAAPVFTNPAVSYVDGPRPAGDGDEMIRRNVASADGLPLIAEKVGGDEVSNGQLTAMLNGGQHVAQHVSKSTPAAAPRKPRRKAANGGHHGPYRFSFRIPPDQHRRLRVAAAQKNISLQQALTEALENYLDGLCACSLKECNCLAPQNGKTNGKAN